MLHSHFVRFKRSVSGVVSRKFSHRQKRVNYENHENHESDDVCNEINSARFGEMYDALKRALTDQNRAGKYHMTQHKTGQNQPADALRHILQSHNAAFFAVYGSARKAFNAT